MTQHQEWPIINQQDRLDTQVTTNNTIKANLDIATYVRRSKVANAFEAKVPVTSNWNLKLLSNCEGSRLVPLQLVFIVLDV